jgi:hypothetical protein
LLAVVVPPPGHRVAALMHLFHECPVEGPIETMLNPGLSRPFVMMTLGSIRIHVSTLADAHELLAAAALAEELLSRALSGG